MKKQGVTRHHWNDALLLGGGPGPWRRVEDLRPGAGYASQQPQALE
jgi:hypothetical protein